MFMYYTVCYFTGIFYAVLKQISMLFIDNKDFVFWTTHTLLPSPIYLLPNGYQPTT